MYNNVLAILELKQISRLLCERGGREGGRVRGTVYNYVPAILEFKQSQGCSLMNIKPANQSCLSIYTITSVPRRAVPCRAVRLLPDVRGRGARGVPVDLHVTMEGPGCTGGRVRGGATSPRTKNSRGPGARQTGRIQNSA